MSTVTKSRPPASDVLSITASGDSGTISFQYATCGFRASATNTWWFGARQSVSITSWSPAMSTLSRLWSVSATVTMGPLVSTFFR